MTSVTPTGGTVTAGKWNLTNTGVTIVVPLTTNDNSLDGGKVDIIATESNANNFENVIINQTIRQMREVMVQRQLIFLRIK